MRRALPAPARFHAIAAGRDLRGNSVPATYFESRKKREKEERKRVFWAMMIDFAVGWWGPYMRGERDFIYIYIYILCTEAHGNGGVFWGWTTAKRCVHGNLKNKGRNSAAPDHRMNRGTPPPARPPARAIYTSKRSRPEKGKEKTFHEISGFGSRLE